MDTRYKDDIPLNEWLSSSEFHHFHLEYPLSLGIYIPAELHRRIRHDSKTGNHLKEINTESLIWLSNQSIIDSEQNITEIHKRDIKKTGLDEIKLQRFSKRNMERILSIEPMQVGDSLDNVLSRVLDDCERQRGIYNVY